MKRLHLTLAASALTLAGCAATSADQPEAPVAFDASRQCFFTSQINGFSNAPDGPNGEERLVVHTGPNDSWLFEAFGNSCNDLDFAQGVAFDPRTMTSLCTGTTETLLVPRPGGGPAERCSVRLLGKVIEQD
jgi:hypothetical protein